MKSKLPIINTILLISIFVYTMIGSINFEAKNQNKQVYVITVELYEEFEYQQELNSEFLSIKDKRQKELQLEKDALIMLEQSVDLNNATPEQIKEYEYHYKRFLDLEGSVSNELTELNNTYTSQIWNKLNSFIQDFGSLYEYDIILGATGNGSVLYAKEVNNITQDLIAFCNAKYNGN